MDPLVVNTRQGLYCPKGNFYIDPWRAVDRALITHAHSDHARSGSKSYLTAATGEHVLRQRLSKKAVIETVEYGRSVTISGVKVSFHSAGHVLGSAQIRLEHKGQVWVVSGDYKTVPDSTCDAFEPVKCHTFITESTFGLPIYRWPSPSEVSRSINGWWQRNQEKGLASVLMGYSFGKAQRLLSLLDPSLGSIFVHPKIDLMNRAYINTGIKLHSYRNIEETMAGTRFASSLIITPPGADDDVWRSRVYDDYAVGVASGWTRVRNRQAYNYHDESFVLSDHADWDELLSVIRETEAEQVIVTHGFVDPLLKHLNGRGIKAKSFKTKFNGEDKLDELSSPEKQELAPV